MALGKKLNLSTVKKRTTPAAMGTAPPRPKPGKPMKPVAIEERAARAKMSEGGILTTGEHPERDAYMKRTGKTKDPLEAAGGKVARSFVNNQAGPRKGMTALEILKGGAKFHVYYTPKGRRQVFKVPARGTPRVTASVTQPRTS